MLLDGDREVLTRSLGMANHNDFARLGRLALDWTVLEDGVGIARGSMPTPGLAPRASGQIAVLLPAFVPRPGREYLLTVTAQARDASVEDVPAGWRNGFEQFALGSGPTVATSTMSGTVEIQPAAGITTLHTAAASLRIDDNTGLLRDYAADDVVLLSGGTLNFTRAPTDNDIGIGVGGDTQWSDVDRPLPRYRVPLATRAYRFTLMLLRSEGTTPDKASPASATSEE